MSASWSSYDKTSMLSGSGISSGVQITPTALQTLANNHNVCRAVYAPPVAQAWATRGHACPHNAAAGLYDMYAAQIAQERDGRGLTAHITYSSLNSGTFRLVAADGVSTEIASVTFSSSGGTITTAQISVDTPIAAPIDLRLQCSTDSTSTEQVTVFGWVVHWQRIASSPVSDDSKEAGGFQWAQSTDFAATEPLSVEHINRLRGGPRTLFDSVPQVFFSAQTELATDASGWQTTATSETLILRSFVRFRRPARVKFRGLFLGSAGASCKIYVGSKYQTLAYGHDLSTGDPSNPWTSSELDFRETLVFDVGDQQDAWIRVYIAAGSASVGARLYSLTGELA